MKEYELVIIDFIEKWNESDNFKQNNHNDENFILNINKFLEECDVSDIEFDGEGSYFGKQINILSPHRKYSYFLSSDVKQIWIEIVYCDEKIVIYDGYHNGFWVPAYISLDNSSKYFYSMYNTLVSKLKEFVGI